jgi:TonB family protein
MGTDLKRVPDAEARPRLPQSPMLQFGHTPGGTDFQQKQRRRMLVAAILLLAAIGVILIRDWGLWFGPDDANVDEIETTQAAAPNHASPVPSRLRVSKPRKHQALDVPAPNPVESPAVVTDRKALPPLDVEVVAGRASRTLHPGSDAIKVEMQDGTEPISSPLLQSADINQTPATNAAERVKMSPDTTRALQTPVDPSYPVLARQMKVQGSVVIQALISADGSIQDLRILSGPSILASAAQEAVRQWRFKPYLQNGQRVETQAKITVNFTISTF